MSDNLSKALRSLEGLSTGDAFGQLFFGLWPFPASESDLPAGIWRWTDDTHMALSIVEILKIYGYIEQDALAQAFARRFQQEPHRGYAGGATHLLHQIASGAHWRVVSPKLFGGGSYGNGGAMRVAPVGAFFHGDLERAAREAQRSAIVTHAHAEGQAGAMAVAVAAAIAANASHPSGRALVEEVLKFVPETMTKERLRVAMEIPPEDLYQAVRVLGSGTEVSAWDTVPFCVWSAAHHLDDFAAALWWTARGMGDCDTTCAIVGGIVALSADEIPNTWMQQREPIPII